jgi:zinc/manganese transport system substrate-binding protein
MITRRQSIASLGAVLLITSGPAQAQSSPKLKIVTSFTILQDFAREVAGDRATVTTLVGRDADAHVYSPTPADAKAVAEAEILIVNGLNFEGWMDRLVKSSATKARIITITDKIRPLVSNVHAEGGKHSHGKHGHSEAADPHAWQDVANAKIAIAAIRDGLIAADPISRPVFEANAAAYLARLDAVDSDIKAEIAKIRPDRRKVITSHEAFGYFAKAYGIRFISPQGVSTEAEASAMDVARIIRQIREQKIPAVFLENITNPRLSEQIARETGVRMGGRLYSDALSAETGPASTYILMMQHNIRELAKALGSGST